MINNNIESFSLPILISGAARRQANEFGRAQLTREKAQQVYFNTLAVLLMKDYLEIMGVKTNLAASDSWNPIIRYCSDVADLEITDLGRLECRPIAENQQTCVIPPEVWIDRIGYVIIEIKKSLKEAIIWGFTTTVNNEELSLNHLQPIENLLGHLHTLRPKQPIQLGKWLLGIFEENWKTVESVFYKENNNTAFCWRSGNYLLDNVVQRAKILDLGMQLGKEKLALLVGITPDNKHLTVRIQLHPSNGEMYLSPDINLILLSTTGEIIQEVRSRFLDNYIQLPRFRGKPGESFRLQVSQYNNIITEDFVI